MVAARDIDLGSAQDTTRQTRSSKGREVSIEAARDRTMVDVQNVSRDQYTRTMRDAETASGGKVTAGSNLTILGKRDAKGEGGNISLRGAYVSAEHRQASLIADNNLTVDALTLQDRSIDESFMRKSGFLSKTAIEQGSYAEGNYSNSRVNADYASVTEQTGIFAGDGGYHVDVKGNTNLKGAVITSSDQAIADGSNFFRTSTLTHSDIQNTDQYKASGISLGGGYGRNTQPEGTTQRFLPGTTGAAAGVSQERNSLNSTTRSGISTGTVVVTGQDASQALAGLETNLGGSAPVNSLAKSWDGQKLQEKVEAQAQITGLFGQSASKAIGDYATGKLREALQLRTQASQESDPWKQAELAAQAQDIENHWGEGGAYRVALHTATGALTGNLSGAAGALTSSTIMPALAEHLDQMGAPEAVRQAAAVVAASALGAATGGAAGAAAAVNVDVNNRQLHQDEKALAKKMAENSHGKYTQAQIEAQMRLSNRVDMNGKILESGSPDQIDAATTKPTDSGITWASVPGTTQIREQQVQPDAVLIAYIQDQQHSMIGDVPYVSKQDYSQVPRYSYSPGATPTARCGAGQADCAAGLPAGMSEEELNRRRAIGADVASWVGQQSGRIGTTATAATGVPGPHVALAELIAALATSTNLSATAIEQLLRPAPGAMAVETIGSGVGEATNAVPGYGKLLAPAINEIIEAWKNSNSSERLKSAIDEKVKK